MTVQDPPPSSSIPPVLEDWDVMSAQRVAAADARIDRWHKGRWGAALGVGPQVVLLVLYVLLLAAGAGPFAWMVAVLNVYLVPLAGVAGVACLLWRATRPFGAALLLSTAVGAAAFTLICASIGSL